ncbi:hypothetical protein HYH02_003085 [Chlamydomonas schloesseri]|uniref:SRCR domain-containing protein n=1 Tax=Chlamydomonas schloesseri TaxID=2026947 RepID=A0A836BAF6_9CHLO|nr:hypothetical protein HYH02_003085 [Chlamydomonas schloesseri]|eukprot:KAG2452049.1 hypothetical protein HYH02_003085 [Chlamydomonas schloesseri]
MPVCLPGFDNTAAALACRAAGLAGGRHVNTTSTPANATSGGGSGGGSGTSYQKVSFAPSRQVGAFRLLRQVSCPAWATSLAFCRAELVDWAGPRECASLTAVVCDTVASPPPPATPEVDAPPPGDMPPDPADWDLDIVVGWTVGRTDYELGFSTDHISVRGGLYGGNNLVNRTSWERVYWPRGSTPDAATYHVCVRWFTDSRLLFLGLELKVAVEGLQAYSEVATWGTWVTRNTACTPSANGYIGYTGF